MLKLVKLVGGIKSKCTSCERMVDIMKRSVFWIKNCTLDDDRGSKSFCDNCPYYNQCRMDAIKIVDLCFY